MFQSSSYFRLWLSGHFGQQKCVVRILSLASFVPILQNYKSKKVTRNMSIKMAGEKVSNVGNDNILRLIVSES